MSDYNPVGAPPVIYPPKDAPPVEDPPYDAPPVDAPPCDLIEEYSGVDVCEYIDTSILDCPVI